MFYFCSLRLPGLTLKCNVLFGLVGTENTRKRLKAFKNDWIQACKSFWTLPIPTGCKLKLWLHTHAHGIAACSRHTSMNTETCVLKLQHFLPAINIFYNWSMKNNETKHARLRVFFLCMVFIFPFFHEREIKAKWSRSGIEIRAIGEAE